MFRSYIVENSKTIRVIQGWGRGYVVIPEGNVLHGLETIDLDIDVHGGVTWSASARNTSNTPEWVKDTDWIIGFDTSHGGNNPKYHDREYVELQTNKLMIELLLLTHNLNLRKKELITGEL